MATIIKDLGPVSAYAYAVTQGYTGTEEEFAELMASYADVGQTAVTAAQTATAKASEAATSATTATNKATEATTAATTAANKATEASTSASTAGSKASEASASATTASTKASEAAQSATSANTAKTDAVAAKTAAQTAQTAAEAAQSAAETAQGKAEDAQEAAEDAAESISASAAQIATNTADIAELKSEVSALPTDGVVANSKQLLSENGTDNTEPYMFRAVPVNADRAELDAVIGGTVVWNQLADFTFIPTASKGITYSSVDGKSATFNGTATSVESRSGWFGISETRIDMQIGHKFLMIPKIISGSFDNGTITYNLFDSAPRDFNTPMIAVVGETQTAQRLRIAVTNGTVVNNFTVTFICVDLTAMFGTTIADYIYQLEQSTAGAGVAFFRKLFPKDYYPYDAGTLKSVEGVSEKVTRDADNNVLGTYPLDSTLTLRGIPKLADGKLSYDGDRYLPDGTVTRKYGYAIFDGTEDGWQWYNGYKQASIILPSVARYDDPYFVGWISNKLNPIANAYRGDNTGNYVTMISSGASVAFSAPNFTTLEEFKTWAAANHPSVVYELATPTTETADPYQSLQVCDPNGTEEFVSTGIVPVGHETRYPENLRAKIEGLPWDFSSLIAPTEKTTTASRNYTTGSLLIMNNVLYKATANIANGGTITPNTNVTATTLSEVISALQ